MTDIPGGMDSQDALAAEDAAAHDRALGEAGPGDVTYPAGGGTAVLTTDPYDILGRRDSGPAVTPYEGDWPDGLPPTPADWDRMTPEGRTDWLIDAGWAGVIDGAGQPVPDDPWGGLGVDPGIPAGVRGDLVQEGPAVSTVRRPRPDRVDDPHHRDFRRQAEMGQTRGPAGGGGAAGRRRVFGRGQRGTGIAGTGISINLLNLNLAGWLSPRTEIGSGNTGLATGTRRRR